LQTKIKIVIVRKANPLSLDEEVLERKQHLKEFRSQLVGSLVWGQRPEYRKNQKQKFDALY